MTGLGARGAAKVRCVIAGSVEVSSVDEGIESLTGHPRHAFLAGTVQLRDLFHDDDADLVGQLFAPVPAAPATVNLRVRGLRGRIVCVRCAYEKRRTATGTIELELSLEAATALRAEIEESTIVANFIAMMENTDDFIYFKDRNHVFTGASQTLVRITDPSEHWRDLLGRTDYEVFPEELADKYYSLEKEVFSGTVQVAQEVQPFLDNQGKPGWVDNRKYPIKDAAGSIVGLFGVARDISATKLAEEARAEALARLQGIASQVPGVLYQFVLRPDGTSSFPYASDAIREFYGVSPEEAAADSAKLFAAIAPEDLAQVRASLEVSARELTPFVNEHRVCLPNGEVRHAFANAVPQRLPDGAVLWHGFVSDITDATARKRAEAELRIAATAFESRDGTIVTDANNVILKVNRAFTELTGFSADEAVGHGPSLVRSGAHPPAFYEAVWECVARTGNWQGETSFKRKDGAVRPAWMSIATVRASAGEVTNYVIAFSDITERRHLEEQVLHSQKLEAVGQLAGGVAHDFNNLLMVILSCSSLAQRELGSDAPVSEDLREITRAAEHARALTQQLLAFSRKQVLEPRAVDLNQVVAEAETLLQRLLTESIELVTLRAPGLGQVRADPTQIKQVIMNLALNARDAMPRGGTLTIVTANVVLGASDVEVIDGTFVPGDYVQLAVVDTGAGMDAATQARLFEPFFTTKELGRGTGLGLSMVYGVVKQSGGSIRVFSEPGRGATFKVCLPRVDVHAEPSLGAARVAPLAGASPRGETILIVEDADPVRSLMRRVLEHAGYTTLVASDGVEALAVAAAHTGEIHLLLTDVVMPRLDGPGLAERLVGVRPSTRVLYVSGYTDDALGVGGVLEGGTNLLGKPFSTERLTSRVREILDAPRRPSSRPLA
jgi:PAS domain S-box-containing protein